jgi:hypothetical protein
MRPFSSPHGELVEPWGGGSYHSTLIRSAPGEVVVAKHLWMIPGAGLWMNIRYHEL